MPRILYVVNIPRFFVSHRLPLAQAAHEAGYEVYIATSDADTENVERIKATGLPFHPLPLAQHGTNPLAEVRTLWALVRLYRHLKPDIIHHVSIKPVLYGGIAAQLAGIRGVVGMMSGLGYVFLGEDFKPRLLRMLVKPVMKLAMRGRQTRMIFQNPDDRARFISMGLIPADRAVVILGSGVDMSIFTPQPEDNGLPIVLFAGRLMWQKGISELVEAARQLQGQARFVIVGYTEATSPDQVTQAQVEAWQAEGVIEWWGKRDDMPQVFAESHIVCLASKYGEGVPKVLIEASACERAIVTTDIPGCREIGRDGENGLVVPPADSKALANAIQQLIDDPEQRRQMGKRGREIVEAEFSLKQVVQQTFAVYDLLHENQTQFTSA